MIYITGDCHREYRRFNTQNFPEQKEMTKEDYVIVCGDFGGVWSFEKEDKEEKHLLDWLEEKPFTTLYVDGNHENFDRLYGYPIENWQGGYVHKIRPSVLQCADRSLKSVIEAFLPLAEQAVMISAVEF